MYSIEVKTVFSAAHALRSSRGTEVTHGHNFQVTARLTCQKLDELQTVVDFHTIQRLLDEILAPWHQQNLNFLDTFRTRINPSAERIAELVGMQLHAALAALPDAPVSARGLKVVEVRVTEAPDCLAIWQP